MARCSRSRTSPSASAATSRSTRLARGRARAGHRAHRAERRGQDHAVQRDHRPAPADSGRILHRRRDLTGLSPTKRARRGPGPHVPAARALQPPHACARTSASRADIRHGWSQRQGQPGRGRRADHRAGRARARRRRRVDSLPTGQCRLVELGRALATKPRCCCSTSRRRVRTRPRPSTSAAAPASSPREGMAVVLVEHDVPLVMDVCTTVHVLDFGRIIATGDPDRDPARRGGARRVPRDRKRPVTRRPPSSTRTCSSCAASAPATTDRRAVRHRPRGPRGQRGRAARPERRRQDHDAAGRRRAAPADRGRRHGRRAAGERARPEDLARRGLCLIPEGRGIFPNLTVRENLRMSSAGNLVKTAQLSPDQGIDSHPLKLA